MHIKIELKHWGLFNNYPTITPPIIREEFKTDILKILT